MSLTVRHRKTLEHGDSIQHMCLGYNETGQQHTGPACPRSPWVAGTRTHRAVPQADFCGLAPPSLRSLNEYAPSFMLGPVLGASHACGIGVSQLPHEVSRSSFPFYQMRNRLTQNHFLRLVGGRPQIPTQVGLRAKPVIPIPACILGLSFSR